MCRSPSRSKKFKCKEAEIVANADCYKFLSVKGFLLFIHYLGEIGMAFDKAPGFAQEKANEKIKILTLDICKKELEPRYELIRKIIKRAEEN